MAMQHSPLTYQAEHNATRWVALFDLLGTTQLIATGRESDVIRAYSVAMERITARADEPSELGALWFSDTFVIASKDSSPSAFAAIDSAARGFMIELLINRIPARGAIAVGRVYLDTHRVVAFGPALLEALRYGDNQDWIGLIMCPSAAAGVRTMGLSFPRLNWVEFQVPWSPERRPPDAPFQLPAYLLGASGSVNGHNVCRDAMVAMSSPLAPSRQRDKYQRSIQFLDDHPRTSAQEA